MYIRPSSNFFYFQLLSPMIHLKYIFRQYMICTINDTSSKYKTSCTNGKSCSILATVNNRKISCFLETILVLLCLFYTVPPMSNFIETPNISYSCRIEYLKMHFSLVLLMNWVNLIMISEVVVPECEFCNIC